MFSFARLLATLRGNCCFSKSRGLCSNVHRGSARSSPAGCIFPWDKGLPKFGDRFTSLVKNSIVSVLFATPNERPLLRWNHAVDRWFNALCSSAIGQGPRSHSSESKSQLRLRCIVLWFFFKFVFSFNFLGRGSRIATGFFLRGASWPRELVPARGGKG